jgi:hypothetical protein
MSDSQYTPAWNAPGWSQNMLRHPAPMQQIPIRPPLQQAMGPQGPLPAQSLFAGMTPAQLFWLQQLMGRNIGAPAPASQVNPWLIQQLLAGPQGAISPDTQEALGMMGMPALGAQP